MDIIELQKTVIPQIRALNIEPEAISSIKNTEDGWLVLCDVLEKKAVPETFDLLKIFEFKLDKEAKIKEYKLLKKVRRGDIGNIE